MDRAERVLHQRETEAQRKTFGPLASSFDIDVVGITFQPGYPGNLYELERMNFEAESMGERVPVVLVREPDNPYDSNCVAVHCPALGEIGLLGKITAPLAARMAPRLDAGEQWQGEVAYIRIVEEHIAKPGLTIHVTRRDPS